MTAAREAIFAAIRTALGPLAGAPAQTIRQEAERLLQDPETVRPRLPDRPAVDIFVEAVARLPPGATIERVADMAAVPAAAAARLAALGLEPRAKIEPILRDLGWSAAGIEPVSAVDDGVAVTLAEKGVAETASLVLRSGPQTAILDAILPLHHIAVLREADIVRHLEDAFHAADLRRSRNLMLVTGPSGTTDIEGNLVIGVHGPRTLHIIAVGS